MGDILLWVSTALIVFGGYLVFRAVLGWLFRLAVKIYDASPRRRMLARMREVGPADTDEVKIEKADLLLRDFVKVDPFPSWIVVGAIVFSLGMAFAWPTIGYWLCIVSGVALFFWWRGRSSRARKVRSASWLFVQNLRLRLMHHKNLQLALQDIQSSDITPLNEPIKTLLSTHLQTDPSQLFQHVAEVIDQPLFYELSSQIASARNGRIPYWDAVALVEKRSFEEMINVNREDLRGTVTRLSITSILVYLAAIIVGFVLPLIDMILKLVATQ